MTALSRGTRLGPYEVTAQIGAGGMGEVYRATDTTLGREVAIKVLPAAFAHDADRLARFEREAKTLAALNHPNIAAIYELEKTEGTYALVMELVEGPTLADRISQGPIPVDDALPIARQIAEALEVAHEKGITHRDLKPANVQIRPDGTVKVLDFGLAKAMEPPVSSQSGSQSPTITTPAMTQAGMILGTAAYMSPEQARGNPVDKRSDVWAFGVVLYEMLAGRRLFDEPTVSDTVAAVLKGELDLDALPRGTPSGLKQLIARCLTRDSRRRLRDIGEARIAIEDALAHPDTVATADSAHAETSGRLPRWRWVLPWAIAIGALVTAGITAWAPWRAASTPAPVTRLTTDFGADMTLAVNLGSNVLLSPDGRLLALVGSPRPGDRPRLFLRRLDQLQASPFPGTEGARNAFFSPDGRWIGFFADGKLKKIPVSGGAAVTLCDAPDDRGGSWADDGWIAFTPRSGELPLFRVSSDGGAPEPLTTLATGEVTHRWPQILPGGRAVLYTASTATGNYEDANIVVRSLGNGQTRTVHRGGYYARYLPTGHLMYISQGTLFAARFDLEQFEIESQASPVLSDVTSSAGTGGAQFTFAQNGSFVYVPRASDAANRSIEWMGRDGKTQPLRAVAAYVGIRFSPDGDRLAMSILNQQSDIWVYEWRRDILSRLTSHPSLDTDPVWTPDGRRITFRSARNGVDNLYWQRADGTGEPQRLTESKLPQVPMSWHPRGKFLAFHQIEREQDIWILPMDGDEASGWKPGKPTVFLATSFNESEAAFSPDGRWLAYQSDESGRNEVYVRPFPGPGGGVALSTAGGLSPRWSRNGKELFFRTNDQKTMVVTYTAQGNSFHADKPRLWSEGAFTTYDLHPDGQRLAVLKAPESQSTSKSGPLVFISSFFEELRRVAPTANR